MPTYDYECGHCGHRFERRQRMSDPPLQTCPACGKEVRRQFGAGAGVILKGGKKSHGSGALCAWESTGQTCCGRSSRCNSAGCEF